MEPSFAFIINPACGGSAKNSELELLIRRRNDPEIVVSHSDERNRIEMLAERALASGAKTLVAVGGDGTVSAVASAILKSGGVNRLPEGPAKQARLGIIP